MVFLFLLKEDKKRMSVELKNLKGTSDYLPREQYVKQEIVKKLQLIFEKYGYQPIQTPTICYFDVLSSKYSGGAEILKEVYKLTDQGERELALRYDLTIPFAKVIGMNPDIRLPFKRYEIGNVYRDGPVKTGRNREFIQCDVDVVGVKSLMAEAEFMKMASDVYKMLGLDVYIAYNNRKLLSGIIEFVGINSRLSSPVILSIDKLEKIGPDGVESELSMLGIDKTTIKNLLKYMAMSPNELVDLLKKAGCNSLIQNGLDDIEELNLYLKILGISDLLKFTPSLARGLEIYTGTVWEVFVKDSIITSSVGAGGRYDNIIGSFLNNGTNYPAVGMTFGLDVIYEALVINGSIQEKQPTDLYIIPLGTEMQCFKILSDLRDLGINADIEMNGRKLKKSLDYANKRGFPYVIIIGEDELKSGKVMLKQMRYSKELELRIEDIAANIVSD